jgi:hypothetical protein
MKSLTDKQVLEIRELYQSGLYTKKQLSEMYNCSQTTIALWLPEISVYREYKFSLRTQRPKNCYKCGELLETHKTCKWCTILLHDKPCICDEENH